MDTAPKKRVIAPVTAPPSKIMATLPDQALLVILLLADKSMTLMSTIATRALTVQAIAVAARSLGVSDDSIVSRLLTEGSVRNIVQSMVQRGLAAASGDSFKLSSAGVILAKSFSLPATVLPIVAALG